MVSRRDHVEVDLTSAAAGPGKTIADNITTCEEFERGAHFNPYDVVDSMWKIFYFWAENTEIYPIIFSLPAKKRMEKIKALVETVDPYLDVEWYKAALIMEPRPGLQVILLYAGTPGAFRALVKKEQRTKVQPHPLPLIKFADIRMKMVGRYIAMMCCEDLTAYALARLDHMPANEHECEAAAAKIGFQGIAGRSYFYVKNLVDEL
ncbi:uncharacterized protein LOC113516769 isoform X2 [Galleria mellonella]|uniref:Uncharacterized protein LOC113516769 isoform X2 n=1 Tax=Galleria mellonella TaxID=7137 RepID=A0ABM3MW11_GALME|nr:uncharacterized protein LOC113516769 isoform X2 [Galleria mellonella]